MSTHLYRREEFQAFLAVLSIQVHFLNLSGRRGFAMATWLGLVGFSQCIRLYPLPVVALEHYNVSDQAQKLVKSNIELWFTVKSKTTKLQNVQKAIVTGCTISPILFVKAHQSCWKGNTKTKNSQQDTSSRKQGLHGWPNHLYWESHPSALGTTGTRRYCLLRHVWNSSLTSVRCLVIRKGQVKDKFPLRIQEEVTPSLKDQPIKCLDRVWC